MAKTDTNGTVQVKPAFQRAFSALVLAMFIAQIAVMSYWLFRQYPSNHNLSSFLPIGISMVGMPLIFFLTAYYFIPSRPLAAKLFSCLLCAVGGLMLVGLVDIASNQLSIASPMFIDAYWKGVVYQLAGDGVALVVYIVGLVYLARSKSL
jgi:hypothetical protein